MKVTRPMPSFRRTKVPNDKPSVSPVTPSLKSSGNLCSNDNEEQIHEVDAYTLQQICLDRQDGNTVIEVLLEDTGPTNIPRPTEEAPVQRTERKKFLNRFFKGSSPRRSPEAVLPILSTSDSVEHDSDEELDDVPPLRKTRTFKDFGSTVKMSNRHRKRSDHLDTFSSMSSLSGSKATTARSLDNAWKLERHESLGTTSIQDIRNTLKVMDQQLGKASNSGERISRQKVMRALFTVADSLEDLEERESLRKELQGIAKADHQLKTSSLNTIQAVLDTPKDKDWHVEDQENKRDRANIQESSLSKVRDTLTFNLFSSMGKMFSLPKDEKGAADTALDDLLWTEFVENRRRQEEMEPQRDLSQPTKTTRNKVKPMLSRKTVLEVKQYPLYNRKETESPPTQQATQSWWGATTTMASSNNEGSSSSSSSSSRSNNEGSSSSSSSFWEEEGDLDIGDEEFDDYDDDDTTESEQNLKYLPSNITVPQSSPSNQRIQPYQLAKSYPVIPSKNNLERARKPRSARYRVRMA